ncbi:MAG: ABC transporter substrate-binding protein [Lachnospiraceae bacterium]|nr:ABC transporter substrate-binding protein [Lachnospiraceae bacterium]
MKRKWILIMIMGFLLSGFCLIGCQNNEKHTGKVKEQTEESEEEEVKELVVAVNIDSSETELPFASVLLNRSRFWGSLVFQGLLIANENINNVEKDLCEEYTISSDGKTYVFILKDDVLWHDGERLTVDDVVFSIETCLKAQEVNGYIKKGMQGIVGADTFESGTTTSISGITINENSITIKVKKQDNSFLGTLAQLPILPKHCLKDIPVEELSGSDFWKLPIGSGPYEVVSNNDNKEAVLVLNEDYTGKMPKIKQIRYKVLEDPEHDEFDFAITSNPEIIKKFQSQSSYTTVKTGNLYYRYLYFNVDGRKGENEGILKSKRVRQALAMAIDRDSIISKLYKDAAVVVDCGIPESDSWYKKERKTDLSYNPAEAKEILIKEEFDFSKTLVLTRYNSDELSIQLLEDIAAAWNAIGVKTEIVEIGANASNLLWVEAEWYDVGLKNLSAVDYSEWYYEYSSDNQMWSVVLNNRPVFDVLIAALDNTKWAYERAMLYGEIQEMEAEQVFKVPLAVVPQHIVYNSDNLFIPNISLPNFYYYYNLDLAQWELLKE